MMQFEQLRLERLQPSDRAPSVDSCKLSKDTTDTIHKFLAEASSTFSSVQKAIEDAVANHFDAEPKEPKTRTAPKELVKTSTGVIRSFYQAREVNET